MVIRVLVLIAVSVGVFCLWLALDNTEKIYIAPPWEEMNDAQYELYLRLAETNPLAIPEPWEAGYTSAEPVDVVLTAEQEAVLGSLTTVQEVLWWLWRTEPGSINYGQFNNRINYLQCMFLMAAISGFLVSVGIRFALKGEAMWTILFCLIVPSFNLLYLVLPSMDEALSLYTLTIVPSVLLTWWPYPRTDPDYRIYRQRYER